MSYESSSIFDTVEESFDGSGVRGSLTKKSFRCVGRIVQVLMKYLYEICWTVEVICPISTGVRCVLTLLKVLFLFLFSI